MKTIEKRTAAKDIIKIVMKEDSHEEFLIMEQPSLSLEDIKKLTILKKASCRVASMANLDIYGLATMMILGDKDRSMYEGCTVSFEGANELSTKQKKFMYNLIAKCTSTYKWSTFLTHCRNNSVLELRQLRNFGLINGDYFNESQESKATMNTATTAAKSESEVKSQTSEIQTVKKAAQKSKKVLKGSKGNVNKTAVKRKRTRASIKSRRAAR